MNTLIKLLVIKKYELKLLLSSRTWSLLYKISMKKYYDRKVFSERRKLNRNTEIVFYIIRRRPPGAGLFSNVFYALQGIINSRYLVVDIQKEGDKNQKVVGGEKVQYKAQGAGERIVPIVDFQNYYMSQLHLKGEFPIGTNSWEIYFRQLSPFNLDHVYKNYSYIMNDEKFTLGKNYLIQKAPLWVHNQEKLFEVNQVINEYIRPSEKIEVLMKQWKIQIDWNPETALAVGIRGGNYEKYRYPGHAVQSTLGEIISEIELFLEKYPISKIYPQTHDYRNFEGLQKRFGKKLVQKPFSMQKFKNRSEFLSQKSLDRPNHWDKVPELTFEDNSKYLVDIYLVSEARYLISPLSNGMAFAFAKNVRNLIDYKIMNLGVYERK